MKKTYSLDNHRELKSDETIRKGDLYVSDHEVKPVKHSIGLTPRQYGKHYRFFRRRHTKKPNVTIAKRNPITIATKPPGNVPKPTPRFPLVKFKYPSSKRWGAPMERTVKVIALDSVYLTGLEVVGDDHFFKKFLVEKVIDGIKLVGY